MSSASHDHVLFDALFNHIVLPPKLPANPESDSIPLSWELTERLITACKHLQSPDAELPWKTIEASLRLSQSLLPPISKETLAVAFSAIADGEGLEYLAFHVAQQNAALILYKNKQTDEVIFEAFEVSASTRAVLDTNNALRCVFPCRAVAIPVDELAVPSFRDALADFTEQAAETALDRFAARGHKAGTAVVETRDTASPALITEMLFSFLEAIGRPVPIQAVHKRVRDDVVLGTAERPWRRSSYWLILRVFVHRVVALSCPDEGQFSRLGLKLVMCVVLAHLLSDCQNSIESEKVLMLQAKLCRRLAKLQTELDKAPASDNSWCAAQFVRNKAFFATTVAAVGRNMEVLWDQHKKRATRTIPKLPWTAGQADMVLKLTNSGRQLKDLLSVSLAPPNRSGSVCLPSEAEGTVVQVNQLAAQSSSAFKRAERAMLTLKKPFAASEDACIELSGAMVEYMDATQDNFAEDAVIVSQHILNLFELWVAMDSAAIKKCPLLKRYHPVFVPEALDLLCFMSRRDMERLRAVQAYIDRRIERCGGNGTRTLFSNPNHGAAFPAVYMDEEDDQSPLIPLMTRIIQASDESEAAKRRELVMLMAEYETLSAEMKTGTCVCKRLPDGSLDVRGCRRCYKARCRYRLRVQVHEGFMPRGRPERAAILFELKMPTYLAAYRDATWRLCMLGRRLREPSAAVEPAVLLANFAPLKKFARKDGVKSKLTLASQNKAYLQTHFRKLKLPKTAKEVLLPFGPSFTYYDAQNKLWLDQCSETPWYHHLLGPWLPHGITDPFSDAVLYMRSGECPSSYEICATEDQHPPKMPRQEFAAYKAAIAGTYRRWLVLTMELGSSNLNLSNTATQQLFCRLALQSGPRNPKKKLDALGKVHTVFGDEAFCSSLLHQIHQLLTALQSGRRDLEAMSVVVTLTLRLLSLGAESIRKNVADLLRSIRSLLSAWITQLREELRRTSDGETARKVALSAFRASLLSRQTFHTCFAVSETPNFTEDEAGHFLRASVSLSESVIVNIDAIPQELQQLLAQDMSWTALASAVIRKWTIENKTALDTVINETWTDIRGSSLRSFSAWRWHDDGEWLLSQTAATAFVASQTVHYHPLRGHLLIDGKSLGKLPLDIRQHAAILELFPGQHLLTRSSGVAGMEYQIINGSATNHDVHVGLRHGKVVIRALYHGNLLEYIPRDMFRGDATEPDLPTGLIDGCVHWLNLDTGELEMRRKPSIWLNKLSNWVLNVRNHTALRGRARDAGTCLVEPQSSLGRSIAHIFRHFEDPGNLTIFQPLSGVGRLSVEIKRLEMRFFVNRKGLLQSVQLKSEIDPVQDVGTLHGLQSKIVLRNTANPHRKSVMVPIGSDCAWQRDGPHVAVRIANHGVYALFAVDSVLGRLKCAPEPALLYLQALLHALTSFPLPDQLTGRTGTEEAFRCLTAARGQPWKSLNVMPRAILATIQSISPKRKYYPPTMRLYQRTTWDDSLTATIQNEQLEVLAGEILYQSEILGSFDKPAEEQNLQMDVEPPKLHHLAVRGFLRRQIYERSTLPSDTELLLKAREDNVHGPRGVDFRAKASTRVYQTVKSLRAEFGNLPKPESLTKMLKSWAVMDGFHNTFSPLDIARIFNNETYQAFGPLVQRLRTYDASLDRMTQLSLALFAYATESKPIMLNWLVAIATSPELKAVKPPTMNQFSHFKTYDGFNVLRIQELIVSCQGDYAIYLKMHHAKQQGKKKKKKKNAVLSVLGEKTYNELLIQESERLAFKLQNCWPDLPLTQQAFDTTCGNLVLKVVDTKRLWHALGAEMRQLTHNHALSHYAMSLEATTQLLHDTGRAGDVEADVQWQHVMVQPTLSTAATPPPSSHRDHSVTELLRRYQDKTFTVTSDDNIYTASDSEAVHIPNPDILRRLPAISNELSVLFDLVQPFKQSENIIQKQYGEDLETSIVAMATFMEKPPTRPLVMNLDSVLIQIAVAEGSIKSQVSALHSVLTKQSTCHLWLKEGRLWPCDALTVLLEQLRVDRYRSFSSSIQQALISLGCWVSKLQHLQRIHHAMLSQDDKTLRQETINSGHSNWRPTDYPEWLLLEVDNDILIRPVQVDVAKAIISPQSKQNSVLQMNMGSGKTSVVIPMATIVLADAEKLCRVVVPKSLLLQTAQVIQSRIGGLVGRRLLHVPYSRRSPCDAAILTRYENMHCDILKTRGIMLCLPEHILSFKLSGLQRLIDGRPKQGRQMVQIQAWLQATCRDILDESDMTLSVYTQLIYPSGQLATLDGHSHRWLVVEQLLGLVESHSVQLQRTFENQVVVVQRLNGYPIFHFITKSPEDALNALLVDDVCSGRLPQLQIRESGKSARDIVRAIIMGAPVSPFDWDSAIRSLKDESFGAKTLYLLRGLLSQRILIACLKKKWNIQYGLHPDRQPVAVPFEAKGIPSQAAEYGHPDTTLILTCLTFYQQGLSKEQLKQGLLGVMQSDDAAAQYDRWTCSCTGLPTSLRFWNMLDPENDTQVDSLWSYLRFDRAVINHHLNTYIFPRYAKQYPVKLSASGWDIPLLGRGDEEQDGLTTGFSGTNDNKRILPQTIRQNDSPQLLHTNAEVLCHLLESRNSDCYLTMDGGRRFEEQDTLRFLYEKEIRVLIDAGAHILEMENQDVAKTWLSIDIQAEGAVYFGANSQIMVRSRFQKDPMPLIASPFANDLGRCVVYIDEGHTRGTDLNLPAHAKGAVTLGLGQTKDQTVQAAMRLRQLGTTQSVAFLTPPEVYCGVIDLRAAHVGQSTRCLAVTSRDVVRWLLDQSCKANEQMLGLHLSQCHDFCRRTDILWRHPNYATSDRSLAKVLRVVRQDEQHTLQQMYGPRTAEETSAGSASVAAPRLQGFMRNVAQMARHGQSESTSALMQVEQEREVVLQVEHMRAKETRARHVALTFPGLDAVIAWFVRTGRLDMETGPVLQAFDYVGRTSIGARFGIGATASRLYVSREFSRTVKVGVAGDETNILRPVNWILWSPSSETALIIIPEEADAVIPLLRETVSPVVWLLAYATPVTKSMHAFHCLSYLTVPRWPLVRELPAWLGVEVGIVSGRLYFPFAEYRPLLAWLGLLDPDATGARLLAGGLSSDELVAFLHAWLAFRRQTEDVLHTPVGFVCQGQRLAENHFFFSNSTGSTRATGITAEARM